LPPVSCPQSSLLRPGPKPPPGLLRHPSRRRSGAPTFALGRRVGCHDPPTPRARVSRCAPFTLGSPAWPTPAETPERQLRPKSTVLGLAWKIHGRLAGVAQGPEMT